MTNGWSKNAGLRREVFRIAEDIGVDLIRVLKMQAHQSTLVFPLGSKQRFMIMANAYADILAKAGAKKHSHGKARYLDLKRACFLAQLVSKYISKAAIGIADSSLQATVP